MFATEAAAAAERSLFDACVREAKSLTQPRGDNPPLLQTSQLRIVVRRATLTLTLTLTLAVAVALALAVTQAGDQAQP